MEAADVVEQGKEREKKAKKYSILYVDDEETNLRVFKSNFRRYYKVYTSANPIEAIDILKEEDIQLVITDQRMPEMSGTEFLEKILPDHPDVIKIILTGFTDIEAIKDGINRCGIYKYITKPWNFEEMKAVLERAMESYQSVVQTEEHIKTLEVSNEELERKVAERTEELNKINERLISSIRYAGELQRSMLPGDRSLRRLFQDHFVIYKTKYLFSDDFYWASSFNFRKEDYTIVGCLEFDGKGIVGALKTLISDSILNELVHDRKIFHSGDIVKYLKEEVDAAGSSELQCELKASVLVIDNYKQTLQFSGLNHDMIVFNGGSDMVVLKGEDASKIDGLNDEKIDLKPNSTFYMYTTGYYNQSNIDEIPFGYDKFEELLRSVHGQPMEEQGKLLQQTIEDWVGDSGLADDITVMGFRLNEE
ncbi:MAG: response regulator [Bacteroidota bacterium]